MADLYNLLDQLPLQQPDDEEQQLHESPSSPDDVDVENWNEPVEQIDLQIKPTQTNTDNDNDVDEDTLMKTKEAAAEKESLDKLPYTKLKKLWIAEQHCPELMPFDSDTVEACQEGIAEAEDLLDQLLNDDGNSNNNPMITSIWSTAVSADMERVKFILADWLRLRLQKIENYPLYYKNMMKDSRDRMSAPEELYLKEYNSLLERHLHRTVMDHFPQSLWRTLDEPDMVDAPDLDKFVFCRTAKDEDLTIGDEVIEGGTSICVPYRSVRDLFLEGKIEVLP